MSEKILIGHSVNDLDCMGSLVLALHIYPGYKAVRSGRLHPGAQNLFTLFRDKLNFLVPRDLKEMTVSEMVVLDTRKLARIQEFLDMLESPPARITVWDHHINEECDIAGAELIQMATGSNTSMLAQELMKRGGSLTSEEATIALVGIYADTGGFSHDNLCPEDFQAAAWLLGMGANLTLVRKLTSRMQYDHQHELFHRILGRLETKDINGQKVRVAYLELDNQVPGLAAVVELVMEVEDCDALFVTFRIERENSHLIIARARSEAIDLSELLTPFGGGGHPQASSAYIKHSADFPIYRHLLQNLKLRLASGVRAGDIMRMVEPIQEDTSVLDASMHLEAINQSGTVVLDAAKAIVGILTLRDIQKARKQNQMHAPVKAFMSRKLISAGADASLREIEQLFYRNSIGHVPILDDERYLGIVGRSAYLDFLKNGLQSSSLVEL